MATDIQSLITQYQAAETEAREKQLGQVETARSLLQQIVDIYGPEGTYGKGMELVLGAQKRQDVSAAAQKGISSGLYGIRDYGAEWESTVGTKARATLEDIRLERRAQALSGLAGFEAGIEYTSPDYGALMQAAQASAGVGGGVSGTYGGAGSTGGAGQSALSQRWESEYAAFQSKYGAQASAGEAVSGTQPIAYPGWGTNNPDLYVGQRAGFGSAQEYAARLGVSTSDPKVWQEVASALGKAAAPATKLPPTTAEEISQFAQTGQVYRPGYGYF